MTSLVKDIQRVQHGFYQVHPAFMSVYGWKIVSWSILHWETGAIEYIECAHKASGWRQWMSRVDGSGTSAVEMNPLHLPLLSSLGSNNTTTTQQISLQMFCLRQRLFYSFLFNIPSRIIFCSYRILLPRKKKTTKFIFIVQAVWLSCSWEWILIKPDSAEEIAGLRSQRTRVVGSSDALTDLKQGPRPPELYLISHEGHLEDTHRAFTCQTMVCCGKASKPGRQ